MRTGGAIGSVLRTLGGPPTTPSLSVADQANGAGAIATVAGSDSGSVNTIYVAASGSTSWTIGGTRTEDGAVSLALSTGRYWAWVSSAVDGNACASTIVLFTVTNASDGFGPEDAFRQILIDAPDVAALVAARIYPQYAPQRVLSPYIIFTLISGDHHRHLTGASGLAAARIQLDMFAVTYVQARDLADKARLALDGYRGTVIGSTGSLFVSRISLESDNDAFVNPLGAQARGPHRASHDYIIWHREAVA